MYIENRNYPGGPWIYFLNTQSHPIDVLFDSTVFILTFLCDVLVVRGHHSRSIATLSTDEDPFRSYGAAGLSGLRRDELPRMPLSSSPSSC